MKEAEIDHNLAALSLAGDMRAWNKLYDKSNKIVAGYTKKYLWLFCLEFISDEDIVSEVYFRAYKKLNAFK